MEEIELDERTYRRNTVLLPVGGGAHQRYAFFACPTCRQSRAPLQPAPEFGQDEAQCVRHCCLECGRFMIPVVRL